MREETRETDKDVCSVLCLVFVLKGERIERFECFDSIFACYGIIYERRKPVRDETRGREADKDLFSILWLCIIERSLCCRV